MSSRHLKLLLLLLPLLVARSMLPIGFMLSFEQGIPQIVLCPGQITVPDKDSRHDAHLTQQRHSHHDGGDQSDKGGGEQSLTCPFAFASTAPLSASSGIAAETPAAEVTACRFDSSFLTLTIAAHPIRGPPTLS